MTTDSPTLSATLARRYGIKSLENKIENKLALQQECGWMEEAKRPMLCLPFGMNEALGGQLLTELLPGILSMPVDIVIVGRGSKEFGSLFTKLAKEHGHRIAIIANEANAIRRMCAAADMALVLHDASKEELDALLTFGTVPVAPKCKHLENYHPNQESGNAFLFEEHNVWHAFAAFVRALETYRFPYDWRTIQKQCMGAVNGTPKSK